MRCIAIVLGGFILLVPMMADLCPSICLTENLYGFGPGGVPCQCDNTKIGPNRTGPNRCVCTTCFSQESDTIVRAFGYIDGVCKFGSDCGHCDMDSPTPTSVQPIPTTAPVTPSNNSTPFTSPYNATNTPAVTQVTGAPANNNSKLVDVTPRGLVLWQVVVITICGVLVLGVGISTAMSCYCNGRRQTDKIDDERAEYQNYWQELNTIDGNGSAPQNHSFTTTPRGSIVSNHRSSNYPLYSDQINSSSAIVPKHLEENKSTTTSSRREIAIEL